jgi:hypothetical protein
MISPQDVQQHDRQRDSLSLHAPSMLPGYLEAVAYLVKARSEGTKSKILHLVNGQPVEGSPNAA